LTDDPSHLKEIIFPLVIPEELILSYLMWILKKEKISTKGKLTPLQNIEYQKILYILDKYNGAFLTSSVGTGKSYVIKEVIRTKLIDNYEVFLIAPTTIIGKNTEKSQWYKVLKENPGIKSQIKIFAEDRIDAGISDMNMDKETRIWLIGIGAIRALNHKQQEELKKVILKKAEKSPLLLVIDEAHHFRNPDSKGTSYLIKLLKELDRVNDRKLQVLLSTATPLNTKIEDLRTLFRLAYPAIRADTKTETDEVRIYAHLKNYKYMDDLLINFNPQNPDDPLVKMRSLFFVKSDWDDVFSSPENILSLAKEKDYTIIKKNLDKFEGKDFFKYIIKKSHKEYSLKTNKRLEELWININEIIPDLFFAPYCFAHLPEEKNINKYLKELQERTPEQEYTFQKIKENIGIIKKGGRAFSFLWFDKNDNIELLFEPERVKHLHIVYKIILAKRAESSLYAFLVTLLRYIFKYFLFKKLLEDTDFSKKRINNYLKEFKKVHKERIELINRISSGNLSIEELDEEDESTSFENMLKTTSESLVSNLEKLKAIKMKMKKIQFGENTIEEIVKKDLQNLEYLLAHTFSILRDFPDKEEDPKIEKLISILKKSKIEDKKLLAFSFFADTLNYIKYYLDKKGINIPNIIYYTADTRKSLPATDLMKKFNDNKSKNRIDFIIATDVLSEGVNLGEAKVFVNYDIEFNPVRIVQRAGRVLRIKWFADKLSEIDDIGEMKKKLYLIIPGDDIVSDTIAKILTKIENRTAAIIGLIGLDYALLNTDKIKKAIKKSKHLKEFLKETAKEWSVREYTGTIPDYIKDIFPLYSEKVRKGEIKNVYKNVFNFFKWAGIIDKDLQIKESDTRIFKYSILNEKSIETKKVDNEFYAIVKLKGKELHREPYTPIEFGERMAEITGNKSLILENEEISLYPPNPDEIKEILKFFEIKIEGGEIERV